RRAETEGQEPEPAMRVGRKRCFSWPQFYRPIAELQMNGGRERKFCRDLALFPPSPLEGEGAPKGRMRSAPSFRHIEAGNSARRTARPSPNPPSARAAKR